MTFALPASAADAASASATATATATASAPAAPAAPAADPAPFGTNLFQGHFSQSSTSKVIQSGDRLIMRLWGGRTMDDILTVDPEGMITIPDVGRVPVAGLPIDAKEPLEQAIKSKLNAAGVVDVEMYIRPMDTQPVSIFVTGFVPRPGNYTGTPSDTILAFLDKAGGIDSKRGSYRNIRVLRQGQEVGSFDLYPFALKGAMPHIRFQDGDTVVVGEKGPSVITSGEVRNTARFEFKPGELTGAKLIELADPQPRATHVSLSGSRGGAPYNLYLPMNDFKALRLENGDQIRFLADRPGDTIMVEAQGAIRGASRFPVRRNTRLHEVMSYIAVEPGRANLEGLYIKRKSVAVRQKKAIEDALRRLEQNAYTATSARSDEAQIRSKEAEMLSNFISRAKEVQPEGVVVVGTKGNIADLALEDGDVIVIREKTDVVLISGEVMMPQAIVWNKDKDMDDYIKGAGGFSNRADESNLIVVHPSGEVVPAPRKCCPAIRCSSCLAWNPRTCRPSRTSRRCSIQGHKSPAKLFEICNRLGGRNLSSERFPLPQTSSLPKAFQPYRIPPPYIPCFRRILRSDLLLNSLEIHDLSVRPCTAATSGSHLTGEPLLCCVENQASHLFMTISQKKMTHYPSARIAADMIPGS